MINTNNLCTFEGRVVADPQVSSIPYNNNGQQQQMTKVEFTLAVDRNMTQKQKQTAQQNGRPTADFPRCEAVGTTADFISKWMKKGKPCKVVGEFQTFSYKDKSGNQQYGYKFVVESAGFTVSDSANNNGVQPQQQNRQQPISNSAPQNFTPVPASPSLPW